jgi:hypothetical protein
VKKQNSNTVLIGTRENTLVRLGKSKNAIFAKIGQNVAVLAG